MGPPSLSQFAESVAYRLTTSSALASSFDVPVLWSRKARSARVFTAAGVGFDLPVPGVGVILGEPVEKRSQFLGRELLHLIFDVLKLLMALAFSVPQSRSAPTAGSKSRDFD